MSITCPRCHDPHVRRSQRRLLDFLFRWFGLVAFRCRSCEHRFFRSRHAVGSTTG